MMASEQQDRLIKLREERIAREKARIEKLREMNLKKYNKSEPQSTLKQSVSNVSVVNKFVKNYSSNLTTKNHVSNAVKNNVHLNGVAKRPISAPTLNKKPSVNKEAVKKAPAVPKIDNKITNVTKNNIKPMQTGNKVVSDKNVKDNVPTGSKNSTQPIANNKSNIQPKGYEHSKNTAVDPKSSRKTIATATVKQNGIKKSVDSRKSIQPPRPIQNQKPNPNRQSVFERLYKPKVVPKESMSDAMKLHTDPNFLKKTLKDSKIILNKRHTLFDTKTTISQPVRRSISAVHFKRISKSELNNCVHKWASIGEKLDKVHLNDINEDDSVKGDVVISAVKSERKRVKFQTPVPFNFNTPTPEELQNRLKNWLQKRGKSLDSFHHLQCFGLHHLARDIKPLAIEPPNFELYDDENKENEPLVSDSDDDSYVENMNEEKDSDKVDFNKDKWRRASYVSDSATDFNESKDMTITSSDTMHQVDELLLGALNDLTELLREGFDWEQCARWLRAIRDRFPSAPDNAAYWECRAALEERRGDLPASVQCWEEAIAKGTEHSVVDANLDQLLGKFMQLHISPSSGRRREADPKMVDVKNVFKSTIIRFAVQQAKLRQSNQNEHTSQPVYTVTPVRRSARLSSHWRTQTPLRICATVKQASELGPTVFKPNHTLAGTP